jgi:CRP/FNR family cyclic AMP-dependent transcriptional regulator
MKSPVSLEDMLRRTSWAQTLSAEDFARALDGTVERLVVPSGGFVCRKGEPVEHWFGVVDGLAKMSSDWATGKTASYTGIAAGGWFGEGSMLKPEPRRYDVVALRDTPRRLHEARNLPLAAGPQHRLQPLRHQPDQRAPRPLHRPARIGTAGWTSMRASPDPSPRCSIRCCNPASNRASPFRRGNRLPGRRLAPAGQSRLRTLEEAGFLITEYGGITVLDLDGLRRFGG